MRVGWEGESTASKERQSLNDEQEEQCSLMSRGREWGRGLATMQGVGGDPVHWATAALTRYMGGGWGSGNETRTENWFILHVSHRHDACGFFFLRELKLAFNPEHFVFDYNKLESFFRKVISRTRTSHSSFSLSCARARACVCVILPN